MLQASRLFHTIRYLKLRQLAARLWFATCRPRPDHRPHPDLRQQLDQWNVLSERPRKLTSEHQVRLLNESRSIAGSDVWNDASTSRLWLYNLHYFDDLTASGWRDRESWHRALIARWIAENPAGSGAGWEPYPISLRVVNWIKWQMAGGALDESATQSLAVQARFLRRRLEHHLLGNHLLANAKALVFAGAFFHGREADEWLDRGTRILRRELPEQVLEDGGHFERSPMYHNLVLEDLLDLLQLSRCYGIKLPAVLPESAERMLRFATVMQHPDGDIPLFNDAAIGVAMRPGELGGYASSLGLLSPPSQSGPAVMERSGFARLALGPTTVFMDVGSVGPDYLPAHAHAGTLSLELSFFDARVVVNGGTSVYGTGAERQRQRGTKAHSTVTIDDADSSEVWAGFRVARRARILRVSWRSDESSSEVIAAHDGYRRLPGQPIHERRLHLTESGLSVEDRIDASGGHTIESRFHLHPEVTAVRHSDSLVILETSRGKVRFVAPAGAELEIVPGTYHPEFGIAAHTSILSLRRYSKGLTRTCSRFEWG